jgi:glycosyltransferase involved in cell wall biosynthesis
MRIAYVTESFPFGYGETYLGPEIAQLSAAGIDIILVPRRPRGTRLAQSQQQGVLAIYAPLFSVRILMRSIVMFFTRPLRVLQAVLMVSKGCPLSVAIRNIAITPKGLWLAHIVESNAVDHIHAYWAHGVATMALVASHISGSQWSFTAHRSDILDDNILKFKAARTAFVRFIAADGLEMARKICGQQELGSTIIQHLGTDIPSDGEIADVSQLHTPPVILCPAALIPRKGHAYLLRAIAELRRSGSVVKVIFAGEGPERTTLEKLARDLCLSNSVVFLGQLSHADVIEQYRRQAIDLVVLATFHEGLPIALVEAMAWGIPVVATKVGGIPELVDGGCGIVVEPGDVQSLAAAISRMLREPDLRRRVATLGRKRVCEEHSVAHCVTRLAQCFRSRS